MGWWSATVLGGDPPLDWLGTLCDEMAVERVDCNEVDCDGYYGYPYTREGLEANLDKLVARIEKDAYEAHVGFQVLGALLLDVGADIPDTLKQRIIRAATEDAWANEGCDERVAYMQDLVDKILASEPGNPVQLATEGLLEKIAERLCG